MNLKYNSLKTDPEQFYKISIDPFKVRNKKSEWKKAEIILSYINSTNSTKLLDIGCGEGIFTNYYYNNITCEKMYGCDISSVAINRAKKLNDKIEFIIYDIIGHPPEKYLRYKFDFVLVSELLYYLPENKLQHAVENIFAFGKKNSKLLICNSQGFSTSELNNLFENLYFIDEIHSYKVLKGYDTLLMKCTRK